MKVTLTVNNHKVVVYADSPDAALASLLNGMMDDFGFVTLPSALDEEG